MQTKPKVAVVRADGINRDEEMVYAFQLTGADAKIVHVNDLRRKNDRFKNYQVLVFPGGFAYGDDIVSGKILATELTSFFADELKNFIEKSDTAVLGVCNGFQALIRTGLLPFRTIGEMHATLTNNDSGHFECRWVNVKVETRSRCVFLNNRTIEQSNNDMLLYPVAHGEGKFFADEKTLQKIQDDNLVAFRYVDSKGNPTSVYPQNPNGAIHAIAGISDMTGRILGLMPHPECFVKIEQHPNWRREKITKPHGLPLFENIVDYVKNA